MPPLYLRQSFSLFATGNVVAPVLHNIIQSRLSGNLKKMRPPGFVRHPLRVDCLEWTFTIPSKACSTQCSAFLVVCNAVARSLRASMTQVFMGRKCNHSLQSMVRTLLPLPVRYAVARYLREPVFPTHGKTSTIPSKAYRAQYSAFLPVIP